MSLNDPTLPKEYKNGKVLFEQNLDAWREAAEQAFAIVDLNLTQLRKDAFLANYEFNNNGAASTPKSLQQQINELVSGAIPINGTASETFIINSDGNGVILSSFGLTATRTYTFPDLDGQLVTVNAVQDIENKTFILPKIRDAGDNNDYIFGVADLAADRTISLPLLLANDVFVFQDFAQSLASKTFVLPKIADSSGGQAYIFAVSDLVANRTVTLPLLAADDVFVFQDFAQSLANKTLVTPIIASFINGQHAHLNAAGGGTLDAAAIASGTFADARISQSSVTQYVNALEANLDHNSLQNLTVGDPHTQYAELAADETVTGTWTFPSAPASPAVNGAYQQGFCKGYINCSSDGVAYTINTSFNIDTVASVYDGGGGYFKVFFNTPFSAANIIICSGTSVRDDGAGVPDSDIVSCTPVSTTQVNVRVYDTTGGNQTAPANGSAFSIAFFGVQ